MADDDKDLDELETSQTEEVSSTSEREVPTAPELTEAEPPTDPPPLTTEYHEHEGRRWLMVAGYLIVAFIVAALIVLAARAIYRHYHHPEPNPTPPPTQPPPPDNKPPKKPKPASHGSSNMPNTGPANTVALFTGITVAAAGLHYIYQLRRADK